jgi:hypothetical protein
MSFDPKCLDLAKEFLSVRHIRRALQSGTEDLLPQPIELMLTAVQAIALARGCLPGHQYYLTKDQMISICENLLKELTGGNKIMSKHTPTPWSFRELRGDDGLGYIEADGHDIIHAGVRDLDAETNRANAAFIVRAVNAHDKLANAMEDILAFLAEKFAEYDEPCDPSETLCPACRRYGCIRLKLENARAALALAKEGAP